MVLKTCIFIEYFADANKLHASIEWVSRMCCEYSIIKLLISQHFSRVFVTVMAYFSTIAIKWFVESQERARATFGSKCMDDMLVPKGISWFLLFNTNIQLQPDMHDAVELSLLLELEPSHLLPSPKRKPLVPMGHSEFTWKPTNPSRKSKRAMSAENQKTFIWSLAKSIFIF